MEKQTVKKEDTMKQIKIAVAGLGEFGSQLVSWVLAGNMEGIKILYCIEPDHQRQPINLLCYSSWIEVPEDLRDRTDVVVDCASKGQGSVNLELYQQFDLPAIFQNGEPVNLCICRLFYAPLYVPLSASQGSSYLKIARCSALSTCSVARPLMGIVGVKNIWACHFKVNNRDRMLTMDYASGLEITRLLGVPARVDVVYLRGVSHNGYAYHGTVHLECLTPPSRSEIIDVLARSPEIVMAHQNIDTFSYPRGTKTLVVEESVEVSGKIIRLAILAFTPEINFPQNEAAIHFLSDLQEKS